MKFQFYSEGAIPVQLLFADATDECLTLLKDKKVFSAKRAEVVYDWHEEHFYVGLGQKASFTYEAMKEAGYKLYQSIKQYNVKEISVCPPAVEGFCNRRLMLAFAEGMYQADYSFDRYQKVNREKRTQQLLDKAKYYEQYGSVCAGEEEEALPFGSVDVTPQDTETSYELIVHYTPDHGPKEVLERAYHRLEGIMEGVYFARDLVNQTSNDLYPETLAEQAKEKLEAAGVRVEVKTREEIEAMGMHAYLSVAKGSDREPHFIVMHWEKDPSKPKTVLVGKGLTYDSGGYSLKPSDSMKTMHADMGGAGTVIGTMLALAKTQAQANVSAVVAACENLVSGHAYKVGDVISSMSGKTIEVLNTDAEGRLTLADAVYYAATELKADTLIDLATLTGACVVALGEEYTGAITNHRALYNAFENACDKVGEKVWLLPNDPAFEKQFKSDIADVKNIAPGGAGTITAGQFIQFFLPEKAPKWLHLDIAGTAYRSSQSGVLPERATGVHVKALVELLSPLAACH